MSGDCSKRNMWEESDVWRSVFDPQNGFFQTIDLIFNLAALSFLWVVLCIPVVTIGPATTAYYYTLVKCIRKGEPSPYHNFLECFKQNFRVSFLAGLICLAAGQLLAAGFYVIYQMALAGDRTAMALLVACSIVTLLLIGALAYLFPVISRFSVGVGGALKTSLQLAIRHLPYTLLLAVLLLGGVLFCIRYLVPLLIVPSLMWLLMSLPLERIFKRYMMPAEGLPEDLAERPWYLR